MSHRLGVIQLRIMEWFNYGSRSGSTTDHGVVQLRIREWFNYGSRSGSTTDHGAVQFNYGSGSGSTTDHGSVKQYGCTSDRGYATSPHDWACTTKWGLRPQLWRTRRVTKTPILQLHLFLDTGLQLYPSHNYYNIIIINMMVTLPPSGVSIRLRSSRRVDLTGV